VVGVGLEGVVRGAGLRGFGWLMYLLKKGAGVRALPTTTYLPTCPSTYLVFLARDSIVCWSVSLVPTVDIVRARTGMSGLRL